MTEEKKDQNTTPEIKPEQELLLSDYKSFFEEDYLDNETDFEIKVYRVNKERNMESYKFLERYHNEIPLEEDIGAKHGGGKFLLWSMHPITKKIKSKRINLDPVFDEIRDRKLAEQKAGESLNQVNGKNAEEQLKYTANFVREIIQPLVKETNTVNQGEKVVTNLMEGMVNMFTSSLKKMQMAVVEQQIKSLQPARKEPEKPATGEIVKGVLSIIDKFGEIFRNAKGAQLDAMKTLAQADPMYQQVQNDPDAIDAVYTAAVERFGKPDTDDLFKKLGFDLAEEEPGDPPGAGAGFAGGTAEGNGEKEAVKTEK